MHVDGWFYSNNPVGALGHIGRGNVQGFNRYNYAYNNIYKYTDPDGRFPCSRSGGCQPSQNPHNVTNTKLQNVGVSPSTIADFIPVISDVKGFVDFANEPSVANGAAAVVGMIPLAGDAAAKAIKVFSKEKQALVDMAKMDKKTNGVTQGDMDAYAELNAELPDPFPSDQVRGLESHPNRPSSHAQEPHGHVGPVNQITEKKE